MTRSDRLWKLISQYHKDAELCAEAGAYLAGCVMLGAALEGALIAMTQLGPLETDIQESSQALRDKNGNLVPATMWPFHRLIALAKELGWLPAKLPADEDIDLDEALEHGDVGDFAEYVREVRNLVHPGKYVREYPDVSIGDKHYQDCYTVFDLSLRHLQWRLDLWKVDLFRKQRRAAQKRQPDFSWDEG